MYDCMLYFLILFFVIIDLVVFGKIKTFISIILKYLTIFITFFKTNLACLHTQINYLTLELHQN